MAKLLRAAGNGDLEKVIELRSDWSFQNKKGKSVLHVAVAEDQLEIVQHLVANGAMLNLQEKKRRFTPLMLALAQQPPSFEEIFQALLKGKPDLSVQDSSGQTILHLAAEYEEAESLQLLLKARAKVDAVDGKKMTALHVAVGKGNLEIVQLLVETGRANVNPVDVKGNAPLHWACIKNGDDQLALISFLIAKGAKPVKNSHGSTPLHSEAMHCDPTASWPTTAAEALTTAFPDLLAEVNNNGLTAQQIFEQGIDTEEPVEDKIASSLSKKGVRRGKAANDEEFQEISAAARAAAIAHSKKVSKGSREGSNGMVPYIWVALLFAVLAVLNALLST
ncbi:hypothetical protein BBO99_00001459 [Phytophthora kernoviae]|uniref:Uncharacterized protein n=2 Tax=Phytophthora kernoviae TaxID=325452 RepID=A0A3R7MV06_9STRA|nr:hypothetical protein G195_003127 [Phytophthora kernoviae 00238/432]KAG2529121.1 hypothetical protein JM16_002175 [Phytophthora kernoviae]KAG2532348.1 hypothetical protein JM18_001289 [Phytophthora kernoviae]RLN43838.1 hypothetical protein BBI17_001228 [Phytophthora kernoviae]RLN84241.1 hypothetical protein BBO99_00001459 [Phytophthora kernoviae]